MKLWLDYLSPYASGLSAPGPARDTEKLTNFWPRYFGTNQIIDNLQHFDEWLKNFLWIVNFYFIDTQNYLHIMPTFPDYMKNETLNEIKRKFVATYDPVIIYFLILIRAHSQMESYACSWPNPLQGERYSFN